MNYLKNKAKEGTSFQKHKMIKAFFPDSSIARSTIRKWQPSFSFRSRSSVSLCYDSHPQHTVFTSASPFRRKHRACLFRQEEKRPMPDRPAFACAFFPTCAALFLFTLLSNSPNCSKDLFRTVFLLLRRVEYGKFLRQNAAKPLLCALTTASKAFTVSPFRCYKAGVARPRFFLSQGTSDGLRRGTPCLRRNI